MKPTLLRILAVLVSISALFAQDSRAETQKAREKGIPDDPEEARIITSDIELFWRAYDRAAPENNLYVFRDEYLRKGSYGLKEFTRLRIGNSCLLVETIEKHPKYYASIRENTLKVESMRDSLRAVFRKLKSLYDQAVFPDVYFLVGRMNSAGTVADKALLIGVEMFGRTPAMPVEELSDWHKQVLKPVEDIPHIVAHELIHLEHKSPKHDNTLLARAIGEGRADFVGELISGRTSNEHLHRYGNPRERELWTQFKRQMHGTETGDWLYQGTAAKDRPADVGYYVGYKICESYYKQAADKKQAVKHILEIQDFKQFLAESKYESKFNE